MNVNLVGNIALGLWSVNLVGIIGTIIVKNLYEAITVSAMVDVYEETRLTVEEAIEGIIVDNGTNLNVIRSSEGMSEVTIKEGINASSGDETINTNNEMSLWLKLHLLLWIIRTKEIS